MTESKFWNAVFYLIQSNGALPPPPTPTLTLTPAPTITSTQDVSITGTTMETETTMQLLLQQKNEEIAQLKEQISKLRLERDLKATATATATATSMSNGTSNSNNHNTIHYCSHCGDRNGKWVMEKESTEFLSLDEEIKSKLREAKKKRLEEVHEQMKFILDTDDMKDSRGQWSCCGNDNYVK
eukprot:CAMPEP_0204619978 /NCGR_PEP_ID=MMETSP0717-20131115/6158_1 /ASSEMBLY_ACC=CAM_ASM_000666 /TAXON_ID=230516 /ORGANISM="Chaetoceros curvisetus" /LENGTH=182 /DNA_ID=CAMNT_0051634061 /DNA_START=120 /DNA_END=668 /DNA_ORIENTATION=+